MADCICLYGLQAFNAVPVDTRIIQMMEKFLVNELNVSEGGSRGSRRRPERFRQAFVNL